MALEAMAAKSPVVVSDTGGMVEIVTTVLQELKSIRMTLTLLHGE